MQNNLTHLSWFVLISLAFFASSAEAGLGKYLQQYNLGIDLTGSQDDVTMTYDMDRNAASSDVCSNDPDNADRKRCRVSMTAGASNGWGIFLQQPFKRQGFFYLTLDVGFGLRLLDGARENKKGQPLESVQFTLIAFVAKPYLQFGITPKKWFPDILISIGPAAQVASGTVAVNDKKESVAIGTASGGGPGALFHGVFELEIVFVRFGEGAFSLFASSDYTGAEGTDFYPKEVDGMRDFKADFSRTVGGSKLLFNWP